MYKATGSPYLTVTVATKPKIKCIYSTVGENNVKHLHTDTNTDTHTSLQRNTDWTLRRFVRPVMCVNGAYRNTWEGLHHFHVYNDILGRGDGLPSFSSAFICIDSSGAKQTSCAPFLVKTSPLRPQLIGWFVYVVTCMFHIKVACLI